MAISCDPNDLAALAKCFKCLPPATLQQIQAYLLCQIVNNGGTGGGGLPTGVEPANTFLAGPPSGPDAIPTFRKMVTADLLTTLTPQFARLGIGTAADLVHLLEIAIGTVTVDTHAVDITGTWNNAAIPFNAFNLNITDTNSLATSTLLRLMIGGSTKFQVSKAGATTMSGGCTALFLAETEVAIAASDIDWSLGGIFTKTIAANTTFTFSNVASGRVIKVVITGDASHTVTWPAVKWAGGVAPTQTLSKVDVYTFIVANGGVIYGSAVQNMS